MPLRSGNSRAVVSGNISELVRSGRRRKQAVAIALDKARQYAALGGSVGPVPKSNRITGEFRNPEERPHGQPFLRPWYMSPRRAEEATGTQRPDDGLPIIPRVHSIARRADGGPVDEYSSLDPIAREGIRLENRGTTDPAQMERNAAINQGALLDITPVIGNYRAARRAQQAAGDIERASDESGRRRAMAGTVLETLSAMSPVPWGRTAGRAASEGSRTANVLIPARPSKGTVLAQEMRDEGVPLDKIWRDTSRVISPEGAVRYEIRDQGMRMRPDLRAGDDLPLSVGVQHPALFDAVPSLGRRNLRVTNQTDQIGTPVARTNEMGDFEINPTGDPRGQLAKLLQYEVNREAGLAQPLRHGTQALERGLDDAATRVDVLDIPERGVLDAYLDQIADVREAYELKRMLEGFSKKGPYSDAAASTVARSAGNVDARVAAARATAPLDQMNTWPYRRSAPYMQTSRQPAFNDMFSLPPENMSREQLIEWLQRWGQYGSGRGKFVRGGRVGRAVKRARAVVGAIRGKSGGRADALPVSVPAGSYVVPADVVAALGQGNTEAGMHFLESRYGRAGKRNGGGGGADLDQ